MASAALRDPERYRFGPYVLEVNERELRRGESLVPLTGRAFDLLVTLVRGAGRTVTKSELMAALWPDTAVEENSLTQAVFVLRKALGEDTEEGGWIRTVPRQGYKFVLPVSVEGSAGRTEDSSRTTGGWRPSRFWSVIAVLGVIALLLAFVRFREVPPDAPIVRSTILPPENARYTDGALALSPDGRRIAFAATPKNGKSQVWIRPLNAGMAQPLDGTEGAQFPFWAPDSRWLGFFGGGKLKKIDTQGGPPITLADAPVPFGGSWSRNGTILFSPNWFALQQISSAGGTATPAAAAAAVGNLQCCPWFLPDGEHYLFTAQMRVGADLRLNLLAASLNSAAPKVIVDASNAAYTQGQLVYLKESTLVAQRFDLKALRTMGDPEAIAEGVATGQRTFLNGLFTVSSTGMLAYLAAGRPSGRQLTWFDRTGKALGTIGEPRAFYDIEASPDWKHLAASAAADKNVDVWTYDLARGLPTRFTFDPSPEFRAMWSPDGRSIVFNSTRTGHGDLYRKSADGSGAEELLYADSTEKYPVSWSRDGKFLLYIAFGGPQQGSLRVLSLTPERPGAPLKSQPFLTTNSELFGQFSPDGKWVAYESGVPQRPDIYVAPFSRPAEKHQISPNGGARPRWRRDGKEIFYLTPAGRLMAAEVTIEADTVSVGAIRELVAGIELGAGYYYDVTADGQRILAVVHTEGGPTPITLVQNWITALKK